MITDSRLLVVRTLSSEQNKLSTKAAYKLLLVLEVVIVPVDVPVYMPLGERRQYDNE